MPALSFEDEIRALLWQRAEQQPLIHEAMTRGKSDATEQAGFDYLALF